MPKRERYSREQKEKNADAAKGCHSITDIFGRFVFILFCFLYISHYFLFIRQKQANRNVFFSDVTRALGKKKNKILFIQDI